MSGLNFRAAILVLVALVLTGCGTVVEPVDYSVFLCERHTQLTSNLDFQNNLLHALLSVDR